MSTLSDQDLAGLHVRFVVPMVVGAMLRGEDTLDDVGEYTMNSIIGELQPDTALLCIALCGQRVGAALSDVPVARMLRAESDRIVEDYGPMWLANDRAPETLDMEEVRTQLSYIPEDLEAMAHLFDAVLAALPDDDDLAMRLCDLLAIQAHEHMDAAEAELMAADLAPLSRGEMHALANKDKIVAFPEVAANMQGNVIPFPGRAARR